MKAKSNIRFSTEPANLGTKQHRLLSSEVTSQSVVFQRHVEDLGQLLRVLSWLHAAGAVMQQTDRPDGCSVPRCSAEL